MRRPSRSRSRRGDGAGRARRASVSFTSVPARRRLDTYCELRGIEFTWSRGHEDMYAAWREESDGEREGTSYLDRYMQLHGLLDEIMRRDRADGHTRSERGWTPPPKGYAEAITVDETPASER